MGFYATYRQKLIDSGTLTQSEALDFFKDLYEISKLRIPEVVGAPYAFKFPTKQYCGPGGLQESSNGWRHGQPLGVCDHFTSTDSHISILKWFSSYNKWKHGTGDYDYSYASTSCVIGLSGEPFLLLDFWNGKSDWHEPLLNGLTIGIDHVNCGELRYLAGGPYYWWPSKWKAVYPYTKVLPPVTLNHYKFKVMQPFTKAQILTNLIIKRAFVCLYKKHNGTLNPMPELFIDHATYRHDTADQGPLWPVNELRVAAFATSPLKDTVFFKDAETEDLSGLTDVDSFDPQVMHNTIDMNWRLPANLEYRVDTTPEILTLRRNLYKLGYKVALSGGLVDPDLFTAIKNFQTDNQLPVTGVADGIVQSHILNKLVTKSKSLS